MGRLGGFRYREITRRLKALGCEFDRHGAGSHEIWINRAAQRSFSVPHHAKDMPEGTLRSILREAGIDVDEFLKA